VRAYKSRPWLWLVTSVAVFVLIGLAVRFDMKGQSVFMMAAVLAYFWELVTGHEELFAAPFIYLAVWAAAAAAIGWLLHSLVIMLLSRDASQKPSV
jgi:hypothetical protein